jgi:hypothetical protein
VYTIRNDKKVPTCNKATKDLAALVVCLVRDSIPLSIFFYFHFVINKKLWRTCLLNYAI